MGCIAALCFAGPASSGRGVDPTVGDVFVADPRVPEGQRADPAVGLVLLCAVDLSLHWARNVLMGQRKADSTVDDMVSCACVRFVFLIDDQKQIQQWTMFCYMSCKSCCYS